MIQIEQLRNEAGQAGDLEQVAMCDRALAGDSNAVADCLAVCREVEINAIDIAEWCADAKAGDYLATYWDGERDPGSRCGWPDSSIDAINKRLARRGLCVHADDTGLVVSDLDAS